MEFRQAKHFLAVVEHGGLVRAAAALHLAQPSLSQSIRVLEREVGTPLFHRVGRGLVPTPVGLALIKPARQLLRDLATAQASVAEYSGLHGGHVDVGSHPGVYAHPLPAIIGDLRRSHPKVTVRLHEYYAEADAEAAVLDGRLEIGFGYQSPEGEEPVAHDPALQIHRLGAEELCMAVPRSVGESLPNPLPYSLIPDLPVIASTSGAYARTALEAELRRRSIRTTLAVVTAHRAALLPLVAAGAGMCWITRGQLEGSDESDVAVLSMSPPVRLTLTAITRAGTLAPAAQALLAAAYRWYGLEPHSDVAPD